VTKFTNDIEK